jgi:hypothetical protein
VRGDWQLLAWLFGRAPLTAIGRWKIFDNLRRSLCCAPALIALLTAGWLVRARRTSPVDRHGLCSAVLPRLRSGDSRSPAACGVSMRDHLRVERENVRASFFQVVL